MDVDTSIEPHPARAGAVPLVGLDYDRRDPTWRSLLAEWAALARTASTFAAPAYFEAQLALCPPGSPVLLTARERGVLVAVLPLLRRGRTLVGLRTDHSHRFDVLGHARAMPALVHGLLGSPGWDVLRVEQLPEGSALATRFVAAARHAGCRVQLREGRRSPVFALAGFESALKPKLRTNLHRCARKARDLVYERITQAEPAALADGLRIEAMAWKGAAGTAIASDPRITRLYEQLARLAADRGELSLSFVRICGTRAAFLLGVEHGGTLHALKIGYDPAFAEVSAGHLVAWRAALDAERRGLEVFDFMGKPDEWKRRWTDATRGHVDLVLYRPSLRGALSFTLHEVVRPRAPRALLTVAQRWVGPDARGLARTLLVPGA